MKAAVAGLPRGRRLALRRLAPSVPSLLAGFALAALAIASYGVARETGLFDVRRIEVTGASAPVRARVKDALAPLEGRSLVGLRPDEVDRCIASLPDVVAVTHDRVFPHTLRVFVLAERPLAVLRRGAESWLVSARARVVRPLAKGARPQLPRIWVPRSVDVEAGDTLSDTAARRAVRVVAVARTRLPGRVRSVRTAGDETALILRSGIEVRLGREQDVRLKLAVAAEVLGQLAGDLGYLDVAVPDRPVAGGGSQPQLDVERTSP